MRQGSLVPPAAASEAVIYVARVRSDRVAFSADGDPMLFQEATPCPGHK